MTATDDQMSKYAAQIAETVLINMMHPVAFEERFFTSQEVANYLGVNIRIFNETLKKTAGFPRPAFTLPPLSGHNEATGVRSSRRERWRAIHVKAWTQSLK